MIETKENDYVDFSTLPKKFKSEKAGDTMTNILPYVKITENAHPPIYGSAGAAGADLCSSEDCVIPAKGKYLVSTGLKFIIPTGHYGRVAPRSGLALKHFIDVGAGVIDEDYRGEVKVLLFNFSDNDFQIKSGDRIAQLICEKFTRFQPTEVKSLDETARGAGGFGSTGIENKIK